MTAISAAPAFAALLEPLIDDGRIVHVEELPARAATFAALAKPLPAPVAARLDGLALWSHQAAAIDLARGGRAVVIATGTASGKSLCYQLPIAEAVADRIRPGSALILTPTKALAHDQLRALEAFDFPHMVAATYDGDATADQRSWARAKANVVLTNPEMLHAGLLPNHQRWATFFGKLRYVVVDELHALRGVFGSHVGNILRRLRRVCEAYGSSPTFIFSSATIGDPEQLAAELCGLPVLAVRDDGSPRGARTFVVLNPPLVDVDEGVRTSANSETAGVAALLIAAGLRTIVFCRSRKTTEYIAADIRARLPALQSEQVRSYRAGYLTEERREIEDDMASGRLLGIVTTTALELGVDIGGVDACVLNGFPGTIASMWQQAGRAGRAQQPSLAVLVCGEDQLDQWLAAHPRALFDRPPEPAVINPANPFVLEPQLACAAFEKPVSYDDGRYWPNHLDDTVRALVIDDRLRLRQRVRRRTEEPIAVWAGKGVPAPRVGLRSGASGEYRIVLDDDTAIGTVDGARAFALVHPGAIYLHQGRAFRVDSLDLDHRRVIVEPFEDDEYTQAKSQIDIRVLQADRTRRVGRADLHLGALEVTTRVTGYQRRHTRSRKILGNVALELPPTVLTTRGVWYTFADALIDDASLADDDEIGASLHAIEHGAIGMLPLFTICDRWDVGGVSIAHHQDTDRPTIFVYDGYPGGAGIAELGFAAADRHLAATLDVIAACSCAAGCPSCVHSPKCGNGNDHLDKAGAGRLLRALLAAPVLPEQISREVR